ncbi:hypothetical protein LF887_18115 [Chryseobacterium sp. MEBOG06]|uniref:RHS repeat domain-containing protein n=1 Tax=Chryseobacterium sp. MEBOG06 TaxID=2879938 RepID=UPI001F392A62|nr:RHS repeat-associated core domain-containing protein [Chryseobacterium sp. MEBOG06]UKB82911.1 hypothetical protein LF887_18115 [Chryseobacterium sp. MEBOG06]
MVSLSSSTRLRKVFNSDLIYPKSSTWVTLLFLNYYDSYLAYSFNPAFPANTPEMMILTNILTPNGRNTTGLPVMSLVKNIEDDSWTKTYTYYDQKGRVIGSYSINHLGGYTKTESKLDFAGLPQQTITTHLRKTGEPGITVKERFVYDNGNRLKEHYHQVDSKPEELLAKNSYNELSQLVNKEVGNNLQSIDYAYNIRGWMTDINKNQMSLTDLGGKLFSYKIKYNQREGIENPDPAQFSGKNVQPRYNGNIAEVDWRAVESLGANPSLTPKRYGYAYDGLNRLLAGYYQNPMNPNSKEHTESLQYDLNGNIMGLYRTSVFNTGTNTATVIDNLSYSYSGNRLNSINDSTNNATGYEGGGNTITYDLNGNMKDMLDKQILGINYNYLNLPNNITRGYDFNINHLYRADGVKVYKRTIEIENGINGTVTSTTDADYLDGFQYSHTTTQSSTSPGGGGTPVEEAEAAFAVSPMRKAMEIEAFSVEQRRVPPPAIKTPDLQFFPTGEGFYDYGKDQYIYQYKDHLGNTRISFGRNSAGALEITDANDYYPFGMNHLKTGNSFFGQGTYKNYKYQGQELQETGMYSFKWRNYMPDVGRFTSVDPLSEKFPYNSTYAFQENKLGMGREFEGLELVPFEFLMMSNSAVRPTTPIAETMIRETQIEGITLTGRATPPPQMGFLERIGNAISKGWDSLTGNNKPETTSTMDKTVEQVKPESITEQVKPENSNEFTKPEGWETKQTKSPGVQHKDPNNPRNNVREMKGNEDSPNPLQQKDYIKYQKDGVLYDKNGQPTNGGRTPESHIPKTEFDQTKMPPFD